MRDLEADLKLCEMATDGPWSEIYLDSTVTNNPHWSVDDDSFSITIATVGAGYGQDGESEANAKFIAAARTGWPETIRELIAAKNRINELEHAIRQHRDSYLNGDDKCWKDNETLYKHLPEGYTLPERDTTVELELCQRYIQSCHDPRVTYISPQRRIEELEASVKQYVELLSQIESPSPLHSRIPAQIEKTTALEAEMKRKDAIILSLSDRVVAQSELLGKKAEKGGI